MSISVREAYIFDATWMFADEFLDQFSEFAGLELFYFLEKLHFGPKAAVVSFFHVDVVQRVAFLRYEERPELRQLVLEDLLEFVSNLVDVAARLIVLLAVAPNQLEVVADFRFGEVRPGLQLSPDCPQVHRLFDDCQVVMQVQLTGKPQLLPCSPPVL